MEVLTVGVADVDHGATVLRWALAEARRRGARLDVLHAVHHGLLHRSPRSYRSAVVDAVALLQRWARSVAAAEFGDVVVCTRTAHQEAEEALCAAAAGSDLLVVGARGRAGAPALALGATAQRVADRAGCPVAVVRGPGAPGGPVVVGVGDDPGHGVLDTGLQWARKHHLDLVLVRVGDALDTYPHLRSRLSPTDRAWAGELDRRLLAAAFDHVRRSQPRSHSEVAVRVVHDEGPSVAGALLEEARDAGLLVLGRGRLSRTVLHCSPVPVLVVPGGAVGLPG